MMKKDYFDKVLTEQEQTYIRNFVDNERMVEAVKKVILASLYSEGAIKLGFEHNPLMNAAFSLVNLPVDKRLPDDVVGKELKVLWEGVRAVQVGFDDIMDYKTPEKVEDKGNPAE